MYARPSEIEINETAPTANTVSTQMSARMSTDNSTHDYLHTDRISTNLLGAADETLEEVAEDEDDTEVYMQKPGHLELHAYMLARMLAHVRTGVHARGRMYLHECARVHLCVCACVRVCVGRCVGA